MSSSQIRSQLDRVRGQRADAEKKVGEFRKKEADKRTAASKAALAAGKSNSETTIKSKLREAQRCEEEANKAAQEAAKWQTKAAGYIKDTNALETKLSKAVQDESVAQERRRKNDLAAAARAAAVERSHFNSRLTQTEARVDQALRQLRAPQPERLRILMLGASAGGELRVSREHQRIQRAVRAASGRDLIQFDVNGSATTADLLDGLARFRPHVVHFSGHGDEELVVFEDDVDELHEGVIVSGQTFAKAIAAVDEPPLLVVLNACHSAAQARALADRVTPFAIGMTEAVTDSDAILYAARFYVAIADGQSIQAAHALGQTDLEFAGLSEQELPVLAHAPDVDPAAAVLVTPPLLVNDNAPA